MCCALGGWGASGDSHNKPCLGQDTLRICRDLEGGFVAHLMFGARGSLKALGVGTGGDAAMCILVPRTACMEHAGPWMDLVAHPM
jgi:hypothetical protein